MKKISLIAVGLLAAMTVSAQTSVVKEAEGLVKSKKYGEALQVVQPALQNPETSGTVLPWYLAGKANVGLWDEFSIMNATGQASPEQQKAGAHALIDAYDYFVKALPLDQLPDAKGKVKPKYTKEMMKAIGENYHPYMNAGLILYNVQDYPGAYKAWDLYVNLPQNPNADQKAFKADPDSVVGQIAYYQGLAAFFSNDYKNAIADVDKALKLGYGDKTSYILGLEASNNLNDEASALRFAKEGNKLYGANDISFLATIVNTSLKAENYPACYEAINESMANAANDSIKSSLYNVTAIINEREGKIEEAKNNLKESIALDPKNAKSYFDMGRLLQNEVAAKEDNADDATRMNVLVPQLKDAIKYYEKSYELDDSQTELPGHIYRLYYTLDQNYHLGDEYAQKAKYWEQLR